MREDGRRRGSRFGHVREVRRRGPVRPGCGVGSVGWSRARRRREEEGAPDGWAPSGGERAGWGNEGEGADGPWWAKSGRQLGFRFFLLLAKNIKNNVFKYL
jgi:hypothetical protein